jgi:hypothetical protein
MSQFLPIAAHGCVPFSYPHTLKEIDDGNCKKLMADVNPAGLAGFVTWRLPENGYFPKIKEDENYNHRNT